MFLSVLATAYAPGRLPLAVGGRSLACRAVRTMMDAELTDEQIDARAALLPKPGDENDPLAVQERPKYGLSAASGRPTELVWGADAPELVEMSEWGEHMLAAGFTRVLYVSDDGMADLHVAALCSSGGFTADAVTSVDMRAENAAEQTMDAMRAAASAGAKIVVHGGASTMVLAQWVLRDYIGSENCAEACELLRSRKRFTGVEWAADADALQRFLGIEDRPSKSSPPPPAPEPPSGEVKVSAGGILLS